MIKIKGWNVLKDDGYVMYYNGNRMECSETYTYKDGDVIVRVKNQAGNSIDERQTRLSKIRNKCPVTFIDDVQRLFYKKT